mmetsp:Transcript_7959/g.15184  ORF Transcript_7959/g.15184 Transcript_7959/m.15184 type:complete len:155 (-) Transcript_7959:492-956(-)
MGGTCSTLTSEIVLENSLSFSDFQTNPDSLTVCPPPSPTCVANTLELVCLLESGPPTDIVLCNGSIIFDDYQYYFDVTGVDSITCEEGPSVCLVLTDPTDHVCPVWGQTDELNISVEGITYLANQDASSAESELELTPEAYIQEYPTVNVTAYP